MPTWLINPLDPLIFRDGRPFGPTPGAIANSLTFPFPSTVAGGARSHAGKDQDGVFRFDEEKDNKKLEQLKALQIRGPLLAEFRTNEHGETRSHWLAPAPADALLFEAKDKPCQRARLLPLRIEGSQSNLDEDLWPVGTPVVRNEKPMSKPPACWYWDQYQQWLLNEQENGARDPIKPEELGHNGPTREQRVHVSMDSERRTGRDGALFGTSGLEFATTLKPSGETRRLALGLDVEHKEGFELHEGLDHFGGERRIVSWQKSSAPFPEPPSGLEEKILKDTACRLILLTPAYFEGGYKPDTKKLQGETNITIDIRAIAIPRAQVVSGWDIQNGHSKPIQRLAPAGTVFFLKLEGDIQAWIKQTWMHNISESDPAKRDGFGLAALGTWSGEQVAMRIESEEQ